MADAMSINVSTQELRGAAEDITTHKDRLRELLNDINKEMDNLEHTWISDASQEIRGKMNGMKGRFDEYDKVVESYASFLISAAEMYERTETTAKTNASHFQ